MSQSSATSGTGPITFEGDGAPRSAWIVPAIIIGGVVLLAVAWLLLKRKS